MNAPDYSTAVTTATSETALVDTLALEREVQLAEKQFAKAALETFLVLCLLVSGIFFCFWFIGLLDQRQSYHYVNHLLIAVLFAGFGLLVFRSGQLRIWQQRLASWVFIPLFGYLVAVNGILPLTHLSVYIVFTYIVSDLNNARVTAAVQLLLALSLLFFDARVQVEILERLIVAAVVTAFFMELFLRGVRQAFSVLRGTASRLQLINKKIESEYRDKQAALQAANDAHVAKAAAEAANVAMRQFVANMSHELRTPLNAIGGMNQLLQSSALSAEQQRYIATSNESTRHLLELIDQVLDFSKIQSGKLQLESRDFLLHEVLQVIETTLRTALQQKPVSVTLKLDPAVPDACCGDALRLRQVLLNLSSNAAKFTHAGEIVVSVRQLAARAGTVKLEFCIADSGVGIAIDKQQQVFNAFTQADCSTTRDYGGTGLGLSISHEIIKLMGSELQLQSSPGEGSRFYFVIDLPLAREAASPASLLENYQRAAGNEEPETMATVAPRPLDGLHLLVVDDNRTNLLIAEELLKLKGAQVTVAGDGGEAITVILEAEPRFDAVLMDIQMPTMDGLQATRLLRQQHGLTQLPIIAMTANAMPSDVDAGRAAGMTDHIVKPIDIEVVAEKILRYSR